MARNRLRFAVVGAGRIGSMHAELLAGSVGGAQLVAVADVDPGRARRLAARLGVATHGVDEAIEAAVDAVAVCAPGSVQADLVVAAARAGRHVFCEKPLALELAAAERAISAAEQAGVLLHVGFNRRFDPSHAAVREAVARGTVGELHLLRITSRDPEAPPAGYDEVSGGLLLDTTIHDFDMARFVTGSGVVDVITRAATRVERPGRVEGDLDTAVSLLRHADGTITTIDNSRNAVYGYDQRVEAFGSKGMASSDNQRVRETTVWGSRGSRSARPRYFFVERYAEAYALQWTAFVAAVRAGGPAPVDGHNAYAALAVALAARRSVELGQPVAVDEVALD